MMSRSLLFGLLVTLAAPMAVLAQPEAAAQHAEAATTDAPEENKTEWNVAAGGIFNSGNTRSWSLTAGTHFGLVRGRHALTVDFLLAYGRAALPDADNPGEFLPTTDVARNTNTAARYDLFLTENDALFLAAKHRWDTFAGLDTRLQIQAGYLRNFVNEDNHRLWAELGYDFTYDNFDPENLTDADGNALPGTDSVHSLRVYVGYKNQLNEHVLFTTGIEGLFDLADFANNTRVNFDAGLQVTVIDSLQLGIGFKLLYDQEPVENRQSVDTITTLNLLYSLL